MNENYLQSIWSKGRLPFHSFKLISGESILVKDRGVYNSNHAGPDFKHASVLYDDLEFYGSVEIHVNSSDWYKHKHHLDHQYDNVILHVVYNHDMDVIQGSYKVPTVELKQFIDPVHYKKYSSEAHDGESVLCGNAQDLGEIDQIYWGSMKSKALIQKLGVKCRRLEGMSKESALQQLLFEAFGMGVNAEAFGCLSDFFTWNELKLLNLSERFQIMLAQSGILNKDNGAEIWHWKGTRPGNFPVKRLEQLSWFIERTDIKKLMLNLELLRTVEELKKYFGNLEKKGKQKIFSERFVIHIIVNAIVPYLWFRGEQDLDSGKQERALTLLSQLPAEDNREVRVWKNGCTAPQSALDSQGLLALKRYYCNHKKCLSCEVGIKLLYS